MGELTSLQKSMLCWLEGTDGAPDKSEGLFKTNPDLAHELIRTLDCLGLVDMSSGINRHHTLTDLGEIKAAKYKMRGSKCPACVTEHCVCTQRIVCARHCGAAGCHGSHD